MYHYTQCGLPNVWLANGYAVHDTPYGKGVSIQDVDGLHRTIGQTIARKPHLTGAELRFLRKELGCSQKALAVIVGASEQTVSLWERDRGNIPAAADHLVRIFYLERVEGNVQVGQFLEKLAQAEQQRQPKTAPKIRLEKSRRAWREAAAVAA
jgi:DNA-binding transcriptional regulator YiaG